MLKKIMLSFFVFIFTCCQNSTEFDDFPDNGKAVVTVGNSLHIGSAYLSSKSTENFNFKSIVIDLGDSVIVEILSEEFREGIIVYDIYQEVVFSLIDKGQMPTIYYGKEGILNLKKVTSEQIIGEFNILLHDAIASCMECPGTLSKTDGKFNAIKM